MRYFAAGEYGDKSGREHYHLIIFSQHMVDVKDEYINGRFVCTNSDFHRAWTLDGEILGHVDVRYIPSLGDGAKIAQYVAGYILKKLTNSSNAGDRNPEFMLSSRRPGIGLQTEIVSIIGDALYDAGVRCLQRDSIHMMRYMGKLWPICPVLREKIQNYIGGPEQGHPNRMIYLDAAAYDEVADPTKYVSRQMKINQALHMADKALKLTREREKI